MWPAFALTSMLGILILAFVDSLGQMACALLRPENRTGLEESLAITGILALFSLAPRLKLLLGQLPDRQAAQIPVSVVAGLSAAVLAGTLLIFVSGLAGGFVWQ